MSPSPHLHQQINADVQDLGTIPEKIDAKPIKIDVKLVKINAEPASGVIQ